MNTYQTTTVQGFLPIITKLLFYGLHLVTRQGGTCHAEGSYGNGYYNTFPIAFSSIAVVIPHQMGPNRNYTNYVNLRSETLEGFTLVGNTNENFATTDGIFLAIGV